MWPDTTRTHTRKQAQPILIITLILARRHKIGIIMGPSPTVGVRLIWGFSEVTIYINDPGVSPVSNELILTSSSPPALTAKRISHSDAVGYQVGEKKN